MFQGLQEAAKGFEEASGDVTGVLDGEVVSVEFQRSLRRSQGVSEEFGGLKGSQSGPRIL